MREIQHDIERWLHEGQAVALAQVIHTWGSSPRVVGSMMAVSDTFSLAGSVSGGCIEGDVVQSCLDCLDNGYGTVEHYHATMERAHEVGLSCGGNVDVLISPLVSELFYLEQNELSAAREYVRIAITKSPDKSLVGTYFLVVNNEAAVSHMQTIPVGESMRMVLPSQGCQDTSFPPLLAKKLAGGVCAGVSNKTTGSIECDEYQFFYSIVKPPLELICIGGVHIAIHLSKLAKELGYRTTVIDPRGIFTGDNRFSFVDELLEEWPQEVFKRKAITSSTALCALTHDPKIDIPALSVALDSPAFYIGSLGRTSTQFSRYNELISLGYGDAQIERISGPIGLDLGGKEPSEIALSIMAEITAVRYTSNFSLKTMRASAQAAREECRVM